MNLLLNLLKETLLAIFFKIAWKAVLERAITRGVIGGLRWLAKLTTNTLDDQTVEDIIASLKGKQLKVADDEPTVATPAPATNQAPDNGNWSE